MAPEIFAHGRWVPLGQYLAAESDELSLSEIFRVAERLRRARTQLNEINALMRTDPAFARQWGKKVIEAEQQYSKAASLYQGFRAFVGLDVAPGISGYLGQVVSGSIVVGAIAVVKFAAVAAAVILLYNVLEPLARGFGDWQQRKRIEAQSQGTLLQSASDFRQSANEKRQQATIASNQGLVDDARRLAAEADEDDRRAAELEKQAGSPGGNGAPGVFGWFQQNWGWVAVGVGGIILAPRIMDAISGD